MTVTEAIERLQHFIRYLESCAIDEDAYKDVIVVLDDNHGGFYVDSLDNFDIHVAHGPEGFKVHLENIMLTDNYGKCHGL